ncbi:ATP-NAD kinase family protein [Latilactobacillus fuchuensis DSM 14340 = JCM 11249]|uniref:NAD kinase n=2 Tax=Latilactobacillus fuchuensis TaxID=164393 RepID=A0A0R1S8F7_9LACO|nr:ATP-NAD kinase family protein [Latilactobacillus fuchuensis DSM 14340 = JCM 11249]
MVYSNDGNSSRHVADRLTKKLTSTGFIMEREHPDVVISVGGDGTLLSAFHKYAADLDHIRFIGVHTGHLGFYTDWRDFEVEDLVVALQEDMGQSISYPLLEVKIKYADTGEMKRELALNEVTLRRYAATLRTDVYIKENFFESFRGDGLCVSTPTGSTAYSKSIGGAVLHPQLDAMQLTEIASINNRVYRTLSSPVILPSNEWLLLKPSKTSDYVVTIDQFTSKDRPIAEMQFKIAKERIQFARYRHTYFWDRVEDAFIGTKHEI